MPGVLEEALNRGHPRVESGAFATGLEVCLDTGGVVLWIGRAQIEAAMTGPQPLCYVCGPDSLVEDVPRLLAALGVPPSRIYTEHWADQAATELRAEPTRAVSPEDEDR